MSRNKSSSAFSQGLRKFFLSAFVVFAFIAYAIHERLTNSNAGLSSASAAPTAGASQDASASSASAPTTDPSSSNSAANSSTQAPAPTSASSSPSGYKDGTYTGSTVDVNYGLVEVQATIQNGKIAASSVSAISKRPPHFTANQRDCHAVSSTGSDSGAVR